MVSMLLSPPPNRNPFLSDDCMHLSTMGQLDALRASGNSGSPFRAVVTGADGRDRSANNDVSLDTMVEEGHVSKKEKKPPGMTRYDVYFP